MKVAISDIRIGYLVSKIQQYKRAWAYSRSNSNAFLCASWSTRKYVLTFGCGYMRLYLQFTTHCDIAKYIQNSPGMLYDGVGPLKCGDKCWNFVASMFTPRISRPVSCGHFRFDLLAYTWHWSVILITYPNVLLSSENVGVAAEISVLSCMQSDIQRMVYVHPVEDDHLRFTNHHVIFDVKEYLL